jgi:hypothetical protein
MSEEAASAVEHQKELSKQIDQLSQQVKASCEEGE